MRFWVGVLIGMGLVVGCVHKPTVVREKNTDTIKPSRGEQAPVLIQQTTRVLDARPALAFATGHIQGSWNVRWDDFSQPNTHFKGLLDSDVNQVARRLARRGIGPDTDVVVIGLGLQGNGEEGRIAWMLQYLGVHKVQVATIDYFSTRLTTQDSLESINVPLWDPSLTSSLTVSRDELTTAMQPRLVRNTHDGQRTKEAERVVIVDVRSEREYLGAGQTTAFPDMNAINIEWKHFLTVEGRPNVQIVEQLKAVGIGPHQRILLVDSSGVRSAAACYALRALGFSNTGHYPGGLEEFVAGVKPKTPLTKPKSKPKNQ